MTSDGCARLIGQNDLKNGNGQKHGNSQQYEDDCVVIRELLPRDAQAMMELRCLCIRHDPESFCMTLEEAQQIRLSQMYSMLQRFCHSQRSMLWGAFFRDQLVGLVGMEELTGNIRQHRGIATSLCVRPDLRQQGIGKALVQVMINYARQCTRLRYLVLEVSSHSEAAIALYQALGFRHNGTEKEALCYGDTYIDLLRMNLRL